MSEHDPSWQESARHQTFSVIASLGSSKEEFWAYAVYRFGKKPSCMNPVERADLLDMALRSVFFGLHAWRSDMFLHAWNLLESDRGTPEQKKHARQATLEHDKAGQELLIEAQPGHRLLALREALRVLPRAEAQPVPSLILSAPEEPKAVASVRFETPEPYAVELHRLAELLKRPVTLQTLDDWQVWGGRPSLPTWRPEQVQKLFKALLARNGQNRTMDLLHGFLLTRDAYEDFQGAA